MISAVIRTAPERFSHSSDSRNIARQPTFVKRIQHFSVAQAPSSIGHARDQGMSPFFMIAYRDSSTGQGQLIQVLEIEASDATDAVHGSG